MTILLLLVTVTITWYGGTAEEARVSMAKVEARKIAGMIEARQLTSRENYQSTQLPGSYAGNGQDPWGHGWTIDPAHAAVLSPGPDGLLDGGVDDISASWEPFTRRAAPITTGTTGSGAGSSGEDSTQGRKDAEAQRKD